MVVALYGVAFAMIVGGSWTIWQGYNYIVLERGWTMVIAGTTLASSGILLVGLAAAVGRLGRIDREIAKLRERVGRLDAPFPVPPPAATPSVAIDEALLAGGLAAAAGSAVAVDRPGGEPPAERVGEAAIPLSPLLAPEPASSPPPPEPVARDAPLDEAIQLDAAMSAAEAKEGPVACESGPSRPETAPPGSAAPETPAPAAAPTVVGTYASGGNTYVMYSDGSIEAETPTARHRFTSLDELKAFIASGGEESSAPEAGRPSG